MSTKLVRYKDVCNAVIPMIADMLQKGDIEPAIDTLKALGELEDADLARAVKEYCDTQREDCKGCKYHDVSRYKGCIFTCNGVAAPDAGGDTAGPHCTQGWGNFVDPDAGHNCADPAQVPEGARIRRPSPRCSSSIAGRGSDKEKENHER